MRSPGSRDSCVDGGRPEDPRLQNRLANTCPTPLGAREQAPTHFPWEFPAGFDAPIQALPMPPA